MPEAVVTPVARDAQWLLQVRPNDRAALAAALGQPLGDAMLRSAAGDGCTVLHLAPDEWLLLGAAGFEGELAARSVACAVPHALIDVSQRSLSLDLSGPAAELLIAGVCGLDLATLAAGGCTRTLLGKITVMLWRRDDSWRVTYPRSYDGYVRALLAAAAEGLEPPLSA